MNNVSVGDDSGITQWRERDRGEPGAEEGEAHRLGFGPLSEEEA